MTADRSAMPPLVLMYGLLGIIPFVAPALVGAIFPTATRAAAFVLAVYGGLILSFLGGARWGFANADPSPSVAVISLSMLPTLVGLVLLMMPPDARRLQMLGLAVALVLHWLWDLRGTGLPHWYARLRTLLTGGAVAGLLAGAVGLT